MNFQGKNFLLEFLFSFSRNKLILEKKIKERFFSGKKTNNISYTSLLFSREKKSHKTLFFPLEKNHGEKSFLQRKVNFFLEAACAKKNSNAKPSEFSFQGFFAEYKKKIGPSELPYERSSPAPYNILIKFWARKQISTINRNFKHSFNILSCLFSVPEFHSVHIRCSYQFLLFV